MSGTDAIRDQNHVPVALGVLSTDATATAPFKINGSGQLLVSNGSISGNVVTPTGAVNGINATFVFTVAPVLISVDNGRLMQKVSSDGTVNWTGTTTVTLAIAPNSDIFGLA